MLIFLESVVDALHAPSTCITQHTCLHSVTPPPTPVIVMQVVIKLLMLHVNTSHGMLSPLLNVNTTL